jgi:hypothetical protein
VKWLFVAVLFPDWRWRNRKDTEQTRFCRHVSLLPNHILHMEELPEI